MRRVLAQEAFYSSEEYDLHAHQFGSSTERRQADLAFDEGFQNAFKNARKLDPSGIKALNVLYEIERNSI